MQDADIAHVRIVQSQFLPSPVDFEVLSDHRRLRNSTLMASGYCVSLIIMTCLVDSTLGLKISCARAVAYMMVSCALAPVHATYTHAMILHVPMSLWDLIYRPAKF